MPEVTYRCGRCPNVRRVIYEEGDTIPKTMKCKLCGIGRMRIPREVVVTSKDQRRSR